MIINVFFNISGFLCVVGAVDGTHNKILTPKDNENAFVNRKNYHSINVQGIYDHEGKRMVFFIFFKPKINHVKSTFNQSGCSSYKHLIFRFS